MKFELRSTLLLDKLQEVASAFEGKFIGAHLSVRDEAAWWYYHEFGTATHSGEGSFDTPPSTTTQTPEGTFNSSGYPIMPLNGVGIRLPGTSAYPEPLIVPMVGGAETLEHPGVPALGLVRSVLEDIHVLAATGIGTSLKEGKYEPLSVTNGLLEKVMPEVLNLIVGSIAEKMGKTEDRDTPGKLGGASPADVFKGAATISEAEE